MAHPGFPGEISKVFTNVTVFRGNFPLWISGDFFVEKAHSEGARLSDKPILIPLWIALSGDGGTR